MSESLGRKKHRNTNKKRLKVFTPKTANELFTRSEEFQNQWEQTLRVISKMRSDGLSLRRAAKQEGVNPRIVNRLAGRALKRRSNGSYAVTKSDSLLRVLQVATPEGTREIAIRSSRDASRLGQYWDAVNKFIRMGDDSRLKQFTGKQIKDANGNKIPLITDQQQLNRLGSAGVLSFESLYGRAA